MVKNALANKNFDNNYEQTPYSETERKLLPVFPEQLRPWQETAQPIEQMYLSHPSEEFSLRLRKSFDANGELLYSATLKDRGEQTDDGLRRLEISTQITKECYEFYRSKEIYPVLRKLRASPMPSVDIDFYEDGHSQIEFEHPKSADIFLAQHHLELVDVTGDRVADNEWRAHMDYRRKSRGQEALVPLANPTFEELASQASRSYEAQGHASLTIAGRSGSGKSTIIQQIKERLGNLHPDVPVITLSTDDYHRGKTWLDQYNNGKPWADWDAEIVYNVGDLKLDIATLRSGKSIPQRYFNFGTQEPEIIGTVTPAPIVIVEGLYAGSPLLDDTVSLRSTLTTPLATCVGRRLVRDAATGRMEGESLGSPEMLLRYMLENAEPSYLAQSSHRT